MRRGLPAIFGAWSSSNLSCFDGGGRYLPTAPLPCRPSPAAEGEDPTTLMKEGGIAVCSSLWVFRSPDATVANLSGYLWWLELWVVAYQKVCADETGSYLPRSAIHRLALDDLQAS